MVLFDDDWPRKRLSGHVVWFGSWVVITAIAAVLRPDPSHHGTHTQLGLPPCPAVLLFHRPCPGCGLTTVSLRQTVYLIQENQMSLEVVGMALLIFAARVADVSLGTLRTAFIVRGKRAFAFAFGFVEVLVWVLVVAQVLKNLNHPIYLVAFALGFASGTVVGITVEGWLAIGEQVVRILTPTAGILASTMRERGFLVTEFTGTGRGGPVSLLFIQVPRRQTDTVIEAAQKLDPSCFWTVDDVRSVSFRPARPRQVSHEHLL